MALRIRSPAFGDGAPIPDQFARRGRNFSPPLDWDGVPEGTKSFVLLVEDPDAPSGTFRHWAVYDIPRDRVGLNQGEDVSKFRVGVNDFGNQGYDGPEPPLGHGVHHYHFRLAALDTARLDGVQGKAKAVAIWDKARPHLIEETELIGTYEAKVMAGEPAG